MILRHLAEVVKEVKPEAVEEAGRFKEKVWNEEEEVRLFTILKANALDVPPLYQHQNTVRYCYISHLLRTASCFSNPQLEYMTMGIVIQLSK